MRYGTPRTRFETLLLPQMKDAYNLSRWLIKNQEDVEDILHWDDEGFAFWAVSDVNAEDLSAFVDLEMQQS